MLREVHLLERLRHPNIISYRHAWLEYSQPSPFGKLLWIRLHWMMSLPSVSFLQAQRSHVYLFLWYVYD